MDNPAIFCCLTQNVARPVFPICARLRHECNQTLLVFATANLEAGVEPYDLRLCLMVFHSCQILLYPQDNLSPVLCHAPIKPGLVDVVHWACGGHPSRPPAVVVDLT